MSPSAPQFERYELEHIGSTKATGEPFYELNYYEARRKGGGRLCMWWGTSQTEGRENGRYSEATDLIPFIDRTTTTH